MIETLKATPVAEAGFESNQFIYLFYSVYMTAVADVINEEYARLGKDVQEFSPIMADCTKKLNTTSEACQTCLQTVECGR